MRIAIASMLQESNTFSPVYTYYEDFAPVCAAWAITANHLRENRGMSVGEAGYYASIPFVLGVGSTWAGGILTDLIGRRANDRSARTILGLISLSTAALLMSAGVWCPQAGLAALLLGCAAGAVAGLMNAASNCAGFASPALMGWVLQRSGDWNFVLLLSAGATAI